MTYDLPTIRTNLKTLLATVSKIAFVYDYLNPDVEGYPAIVFDVGNSKSEMLTDTENLRTITFNIRILCGIAKLGQQGAIDILDSAQTDILTALEKITNMSLGGSVDWIMPSIGPREQLEGTNGAIFSQRLDLEVKISTSIL